jgi:hypothetical protein
MCFAGMSTLDLCRQTVITMNVLQIWRHCSVRVLTNIQIWHDSTSKISCLLGGLGLFNGPFSCTGYVESDHVMTAANELDKMWKETIVSYFKIPEIPCRSCGLPEENRETLIQDSNLTWSWVLQNPAVTEMAKQCSDHCGIRKYITVFVKTRHWFDPEPRESILVLPSYFGRIRFNVKASVQVVRLKFPWIEVITLCRRIQV